MVWLHSLYPLYTGAATFLPPLCDHKTGQVAVEGRKEAERLPCSFIAIDIAMDAMVAVKFWACSKQSHKGRRGGRSLTGRSKGAGGRHTHRRGGRMDGCTVVGHWSPRKQYVLLWTLCINLSNASAFLIPPLCLLWLNNSVHWAITVATTVPPFGDHGNPSATLAMVLPPLCLLCATCCTTTAALVAQGRHKGRAAAVTQKHNSLGLGDHWASWPYFWSLKGGTKVAALCKGGFSASEVIVLE